MASNRLAFLAVSAALIAAFAVPAAAQPPDEPRGFLVGLSGAAITKTTAPVFGGAAGVNLTRHLQITGEVGRMQDLLPNFTRDDLRLAEAGALQEGLVMDLTSKVPTVYAMAGVRVLAPGSRYARPYVLASGGVAHMMPNPTFKLMGIDITDPSMQEGSTLKQMFRDENRPIASVGGGVSVTVARHVAVDIGYKYSRIFIKNDYLQLPGVGSTNPDELPTSPHQHDKVDLHRVYFGVGYAF